MNETVGPLVTTGLIVEERLTVPEKPFRLVNVRIDPRDDPAGKTIADEAEERPKPVMAV